MKVAVSTVRFKTKEIQLTWNWTSAGLQRIPCRVQDTDSNKKPS